MQRIYVESLGEISEDSGTKYIIMAVSSVANFETEGRNGRPPEASNM